jgi:hypothetical protein
MVLLLWGLHLRNTPYQIINSLQQSLSSEAASCWATEIFPNILRNLKIHYRAHMSPTLTPVLNQNNPIHATQFYEEESVNRSQMDIKRITGDIRNWKKHFSTYPSPTLKHLFIALPVLRKSKHRSLLAVVSVTSVHDRALSVTLERPRENFSTQLWTALRDKHFPP